ncbi:uncharacterized protein [Periplaneta americana]|uniref:uncharacterized protein isoform X3 n=1 Tax=Periplaneta americana TaxID=6978 RepID=UPI0037E74E7F
MDSSNYCKISENISEKTPVLITFPTVRCEAEERNLLDEHMTSVKMEYVDQSHDFASEVKFEENPETISFPVVKDEPEDRNFLDQHVTGIKEEYEGQSQDLATEIKFEEDPVPISFPVVKREPEEEQSDLDRVNEEPRVEGTAEDNEIFTECYQKEICIIRMRQNCR